MSTPMPIPHLTAVTLGVRDFHASVRFYEALGFARRLCASGDEIAFFDAGGVVLALYGWDQLAHDAALAPSPTASAFRGTTLAWNCASRTEVDAAFVCALAAGATLLKAAIPAISPIPTGIPGRSSTRLSLPSRPRGSCGFRTDLWISPQANIAID